MDRAEPDNELATRSLPSAESQGSSAKLRLLAVDDNPNDGELIARVAAKCGYEVKTISNPELLPPSMSNWNPDVITLDLCMPKLDGLEASLLLQRLAFAGRVIIISGQDRKLREAARLLFEARGLKVVGTLQKPADLGALRDLLCSLAASTPITSASQA